MTAQIISFPGKRHKRMLVRYHLTTDGRAVILVQDVEIALAAHVRFCRDHPETLQRILVRVNAPAPVGFGAGRDLYGSTANPHMEVTA